MSLSSFFDGLGTLFQPVTDFATKHPVVSAMLINGIAGIFEPSDYDKERDRLRAQRESEGIERKRRNQNLEVGGLRLPEPASRASQYLNNPIRRRQQQAPAMEDPLAQPQPGQGFLRQYLQY